MRRNRRICAERLIDLLSIRLTLLLGLPLTSVCYGQAGDLSKGSLSVDVLDASGATVPNANVTLSGPAGDNKITSSDRGQALFFGLAPATSTR